MTPYRSVDRAHQRKATIAEARRVRDALRDTTRFHHIADGRIRSSQEIVDVLTNCIEELSLAENDPLIAVYHHALGATIDFTKHATFIVRQWDGMDGCWCDCTGDVSRTEALRDWAERTANGTRNVTYAEITYYAIFPGGTRMHWDGSADKEMHR